MSGIDASRSSQVIPSSAAIVAEFAAQPAGDDTITALTTAIITVSDATAGDAVAAAQLDLWRAALASAPELHARIVLIPDDDVRELIRLATQRGGFDDDSLVPGVRVHAVLAAASYAYRLWITDDGRDLPTLIREAAAAL